MAKVNLSVTRTLTINTGNYESIKPSVSLEVTDIDPDNVGDAYLAMEDALTGILNMEVLACAGEGKLVGSGLDQYCKRVIDTKQQIGEEIERSLSKLNDI